MHGFKILPARDGGYYVESVSRQYECPEIRFAGTLAECLEYILNSFEKADAPAPAEGRA
jgi:hypothetical protein